MRWAPSPSPCSRIICWHSSSRAFCCWWRSLAPSYLAEEGPPVLAESLALTAALFIIGVVGVLVHRNAIIIFMCVELMLTAVNLTFVAFSRFYGPAGQVFVVFVMTVSAAEAAVGLAIIIAIFRHRQTINLKDINLLRG